MTDYLNPHKIYTDRVDIAPGFDSERKCKMKKNRTIHEIYEETKSNHTFSDFRVGDKARVCVPCVDFTFFNGEIGTVESNNHSYLGIRLRFDDGTTLPPYFGFNPQDLELVKEKPDTATVKESLTTECDYCNGTEKPLFHENKYEPYECMQSWITICESRESKRHLIEVDLWDGANTYAAFEINYCPMCGRKLWESE